MRVITNFQQTAQHNHTMRDPLNDFFISATTIVRTSCKLIQYNPAFTHHRHCIIIVIKKRYEDYSSLYDLILALTGDSISHLCPAYQKAIT